MCHTRDKKIWGQLVQSGWGQIQGRHKYWSSPSLSEPLLLPFVLYCHLLLPNWAKYGDKYCFPTIHWVPHMEVEKEEERGEKDEVEKEETMEAGEEEDRDNVQLRGSQSSVSRFNFLL